MNLKQYHERRDLGICTMCGKAMADVGHTTCTPCRDRRKQQRDRKFREDGLCTKCHKRPAKEGGRYCQACLDRAEKYRYRVSGDKTPMPVPEEHAGECSRCTLPAVKDGLCARHLKIRERSVMR